MNRKQKVLAIIIGINIVSSLLHYLDNICFFSEYPDPRWITPHFIDFFWVLMTPLACYGFYTYRTGASSRAFGAFYVYALMSLLVLGHYLYAPFEMIPFRIHLFIGLETIAALILL